MTRNKHYNQMFSHIRTILLVTTLLFSALLLYSYRCAFGTCTPASWDSMQTTLLAQANPLFGRPYYFDGLKAKPAFQTKFTDEGPSHLTLDITLIDMSESSDCRCQVKRFETNDRNFHIAWFGDSNVRVHPSPTLETQAHFGRVKLGPRDAYRATWTIAQRELGSAFIPEYSSASLHTNEEVTLALQGESIWVMYYQNGKASLMIWLDAQNGDLVKQTRVFGNSRGKTNVLIWALRPNAQSTRRPE